MKFDSNLAWKEASSTISANREVLLALAGVFFLLPGLAFALLMPAPQAPAGATPQQTLLTMQAYYSASLPFMLPITIIQFIGTLGILALFTDRRRPTVGEALRLGLVGLLPYLGAQILLFLGLTLIGVPLLAIAAAAAGTGGLAIAGVLVAVLMIYLMVKTSLAAPAIIVEGVRNPITALLRSWRLTKGNSIRLALFYLLLFVAFVVIYMIVMTLVGLIGALIAGGEPARMISAVVSSAISAVMTLYFVAAIATAHRQLAGPSPERVSRTFE